MVSFLFGLPALWPILSFVLPHAAIESHLYQRINFSIIDVPLVSLLFLVSPVISIVSGLSYWVSRLAKETEENNNLSALFATVGILMGIILVIYDYMLISFVFTINNWLNESYKWVI